MPFVRYGSAIWDSKKGIRVKVIGQSFSSALISVRNGAKIYREGWGKDNMFVSLSPGMVLAADKFWSPYNKKAAEDNGGNFPVCDSLSLKSPQGVIMGWTPNTVDLFANDWIIE
jgi:hypothetical protein